MIWFNTDISIIQIFLCNYINYYFLCIIFAKDEAI